MSWMWRELNPTDSWSVTTQKPVQTREIGVLIHLYQPIIGAKAVSVYTTLSMQCAFHAAGESPSYTHRYLMNLLNMPLDELLTARWKLEAIGLLKTFKQEEQLGRSFCYELIPPLDADAFFRQDVLSITLMNRLGKEPFRRLREQLCPKTRRDEKTSVEITKPFHEIFTSLKPSELTVSENDGMVAELEAAPAKATVSGPSFDGLELDWEFIEAQAAPVGSLDKLTEADRNKIREWTFFYQLDELALGKALQNPAIYNERNELDMERLHRFIKQEYRFHYGGSPTVLEKDAASQETKAEVASVDGDNMAEVHRQWLGKLSPLELLERYQQGGKVPDADVKLVEKLYEDYGLPYPVINVLIEFVLLTHHYKLPSALVEKIAGHWKRVNPQTVEEAQELALQEWYAQKNRKRPNQKKGKTIRTVPSNGMKKATGSPTKNTQKKPEQSVQETEEDRKRRRATFEQLLEQLKQARLKGE